jgi:aarF domain-containing kinase
MLEESEREREELRRPPEDRPFVVRIVRDIRLLVDSWIIEPIATGLRFAHLLVIFVPVILTIPLVFIGPRSTEWSGERAGTIWWYAFLVRSMERAGPTFIKVSYPTDRFALWSPLPTGVAADVNR